MERSKELQSFVERKEINKNRARKIIKWYEKTRYDVSICAGVGISLSPVSLIRLLSIFGNSKNLEKDFNRLANEPFKEENIEDIIKEVTLDLREYLNMKSDLKEKYHQFGVRILEGNDNFERAKIYGEKIVQGLAESLVGKESYIEQQGI